MRSQLSKINKMRNYCLSFSFWATILLFFAILPQSQAQRLDSMQAVEILATADLYFQNYENEQAIAAYDILINDKSPQLSAQRIEAGIKKALAYQDKQNISQALATYEKIDAAKNSYELNQPYILALLELAKANYYNLCKLTDSVASASKKADAAINQLADSENTISQKAFYYLFKQSLYNERSEAAVQKIACMQALAYADKLTAKNGLLRFAIYQSYYLHSINFDEKAGILKNLNRVQKIAYLPQNIAYKRNKANFLLRNIFMKTALIDTSLFYQAEKEALDYLTENNLLSTNAYADYLIIIALIHKDIKPNYSLARTLYAEMLAKAEKNPLLFKKGQLFDIHTNYAYLCVDNKRDTTQFEQGLALMEKAWQLTLSDKYKGGTWGEFADVSGSETRDLPVNICVRALRGLIHAYNIKYNKDKAEKYKKALFNAVTAAETLLNTVIKLTSNDAQRKNFAFEREELIARKVEIYKNLYNNDPSQENLNQLWQLSQQANARESRYRQSEDKAFELASVDKKLVADYTQAKKQLENAYFRLSIAEKDNQKEQKNDWGKQIATLTLRLGEYKKTIAEKYPLYQKLLGELDWVKIEQMRPLLNNSGLILHFAGRFENFQILLTTDTLIYYNTDLDAQHVAKSLIDSLNLFLNNPPDELAAQQFYKQRFEQLLIQVRDTFFRQWAYLKAKNIQNVIIVPDALTSSIPFEVLLTSDNNNNKSYADWDWAIKSFNFQYLPSLSFWVQSRQQSQANVQNGKLLAFAPTYQNGAKNNLRSPAIKTLRENLSELSGAKAELDNLKIYYYGDYYQNEAANEATFKSKNSQSYSILHFAMHGLLDENLPELSSLAFAETVDTTEDNFLNAFEIGNLRQRCQLVVLSACETAKGQQQKGEGVMSLAQYFLYGGAPSVVATRWQVNDQTTAFIMQNFYKYIYEGQTIKAALRQAQLDYLAQARGVGAHPFYWSPFVNIGDTDKAVYLAGKDWAIKYYVIIALSIVVLGFGAWRYFRGRERV